MVGEWWSILILRDCLRGLTRFDQFQKNLAISPNMLTRRLQTLVDAGLLERRRYCEHPPRHEYILTERGRDFRIVIAAMYDWGSRHLPIEGQTDLPRSSSLPGEDAENYLQGKSEEI
ncbi:winged helix-turn-helix transcriptional regulator [Herbaspirillum hiltneri]|uniref:winged helix-turn-helix transcriptional regulator n=1 Tax=Herbaspirillum hiltneri TaxID=341045 RepID=UPI000B139A80|nr:helix-turn-helix domain-containing protein [Herbaspirillum hiltneri]